MIIKKLLNGWIPIQNFLQVILQKLFGSKFSLIIAFCFFCKSTDFMFLLAVVYLISILHYKKQVTEQLINNIK